MWSILEPMVCPICLSVLLDVPLSNRNLTDTSSSLVPSPCPFSLEEYVFTVHALIPLPPVATVKDLYPPPKECDPNQDAQPLEKAGGLDAECWAQVMLFLDLGCHRFSSCDQEGPIKSISGKKNGFLSEALQQLQSSLLGKGWWWSNFLETHLFLDANEREHSPWRAHSHVLAAVCTSCSPGPWHPVVLAWLFRAMQFAVLDIPGIHR